MASKKTKIILRESKEAIFDMLKADNPTAFGDKVIEDVESFGEDPSDNSKIWIEFKEE